MPGPLAGVRVVDCTTVVLGPLGRPDARRPRRRRHQGRAARGRHHAPARPHAQPRHGRVLPRREPQQALDRARPQAGGGARGAAPARRDGRRARCTTTGRRRRRGSACRTRRSAPSTRGSSTCATYGFRAAGPYGDKPAYDDIIQAASGLASLQASLIGEPRYVPTIVADKTSSMTVLAAVLAALYHKARTGRGPGGRGADVREPGRVGDGRAPLRRDVRAARSTRVGYKRVLNR